MGIFGNAFGWPHLLVILAIVLLLFGAPKLPALAKSIGQSMRIFKGEMKTMKDENGNEQVVAERSEAEPNATGRSTAEPTSTRTSQPATRNNGETGPAEPPVKQ